MKVNKMYFLSELIDPFVKMLGWDFLAEINLQSIIIRLVLATFFGGGFGFVALYLWISDLITLALNKFKYRLSKEAFIMKLNVETRYKISKKYLTVDKIKQEQESIKANLKKKLEKKEAKRRAKSKQ